jgi:hypothetical protein
MCRAFEGALHPRRDELTTTEVRAITMTTPGQSTRSRTGTILTVMVALAACGTETQPIAPVVEDQVELSAILLEAIQDEYRAEAVYAGVIEDFGQVAPFSNIIDAETRHSEAIARLYESRGWSVPDNPWTVSMVPRFEELGAACEAGVVAEVANVAVYDELAARATLPPDVATVFSSNRAASLERHLPAFERCAG